MKTKKKYPRYFTLSDAKARYYYFFLKKKAVQANVFIGMAT